MKMIVFDSIKGFNCFHLHTQVGISFNCYFPSKIDLIAIFIVT